MAGNSSPRNARPVGDFASAILDPVLRRKTGVSTALVQSWEEIAGPRLAQASRPEKILWPRRAGEDDPFEPATLVIACEGASALQLQHQTGEIISRVNAFLGFAAIGRIRILQKPMSNHRKNQRPRPRELSREQAAAVVQSVAGIEDDALRIALEQLGRAVKAERGRR